MSCKGCQDRKRRLLRWLGLDTILTDMGAHFVKHVGVEVRKLQFSNDRLDKKIRDLELQMLSLTDKIESLEFPGFKKPEG